MVLDASNYRCLQPTAEAAKTILGFEGFNVVADDGYLHGEQAAGCEAAGIVPYVPVNNQGDGTLFGREDFRYERDTDTYTCPGTCATKPWIHKGQRPLPLFAEGIRI